MTALFDRNFCDVGVCVCVCVRMYVVCVSPLVVLNVVLLGFVFLAVIYECQFS